MVMMMVMMLMVLREAMRAQMKRPASSDFPSVGPLNSN